MPTSVQLRNTQRIINDRSGRRTRRVSDRHRREGRLQAALDPALRAIEFVPTVTTVAGPVALGAIVLRGADGRRLFDVVEARPLRSLDQPQMTDVEDFQFGQHSCGRDRKCHAANMFRRIDERELTEIHCGDVEAANFRT